MLPSSRRQIFRELVQFALVGGGGFVIDVGVFNALLITVFLPASLHGGPIIAKTISTALAIAANWMGNRLWTVRTRRRSDVTREGIEFAVVSVAGMLIAIACLWVSHYALGLTSLFADNVSSNGVGLLLGAAFRFVLYRWWVFGQARAVLSRQTRVSARL